MASELIVLGSGSSTGVPTPSCVLRPTDPPCEVCRKSLTEPPVINKNYRCNPSLMIKYSKSENETRFIQIDAGKCFREQVLRWFVHHKIPRLDALILTHEHADAILGLDDVRGVQPYDEFNRIPAMPVYLTQHSMNSVSEKFHYLIPKEKAAGASEVVRRVAQLSWNIVQPSVASKFTVSGLEITPLPVWHGEDYICLGFLFGSKQRIAYISDVTVIPPDVEREISIHGKGRLDILFLDALFKENPHNTHISLPESLEIIKRLRPKKAFLVGMTHEFDHERDNAELALWSQREGLDVQLSYDGLSIPVDI